MDRKPSVVIRVFRFIWSVINNTRKLILNLIFFGLLAVLLVAAGSGEEEFTLEQNQALVLNLNGSIVEQKRYQDPFEAVMLQSQGQELEREILLSDLVYAIRNAALDERIGALVIAPSRLHSTGMSKLTQVGQAIEEFKQSGKPVIAASRWYSQSQYYLASFADEIYLNPMGSVALDGFGVYRMYYKEALDKLKVNAHVFRVGTYKSAIEPYLRNDMSDAAREANELWLGQLWQHYVETVSSNRELSADAFPTKDEAFQAQLDENGGDFALMAKNLGWVDDLLITQTFRDKMIELVGENDDHSFNQVSLDDYYNLVKPKPLANDMDKVAVVVAKGTILNGSQPAGQIGGDSTAKLLRKARHDDQVKAVVLRVDSPGGSAFASEVIRQEVLALQEAGKPVVASMSSVAASGGYWISASADYIMANPTTITGSIGIFGLVTTFEDSLDHIGVHTDGVGTSDWAGASVVRGLTPGMKQMIQTGIEKGYRDFLSIVAEGRDMTPADVDKIAQGRVWTGSKALELGLVDELGDLDQALAKAAELAELEEYDQKVIEKELSKEQQFMQQLFGEAKAYLPEPSPKTDVVSMFIDSLNSELSLLTQFNDPNHSYVLCENCRLD
ncbi:signal peptide peptidase SppA [Paraferrimonas sedimenticola]|uniref:Protease n=1 Tax=Paraferrimonas sedimenticola TaxID=375674 RepID=A0AA37RYR0_9GAMM|nr:signal peptide peptidase SppA [Paraferrimonas sedimenticola]GLP97935.1 protease [Paraferrimonas sedimenticola]